MERVCIPLNPAHCVELDYREFEFWYYRVQRGLTDFDCDLSEELDNKPTLSDMPIDVVGLVLDNLNYKMHRVLRKVCKSLREIVDQRAPRYKTLSLSTDHLCTFVTFDNYEVCYRRPKKGGTSAYRYHEMVANRPSNGKAAVVFADCFTPAAMALRDLKRAMEHPNVRLDVLKICFGFSHLFYKHVKAVLSTLPRGTLDVKKLELSVKNQDEMLSVLPYMTPGVLETIIVQSFPQRRRLPLQQVAALDQWKRAKQFHFNRPDASSRHFRPLTIVFRSSVSVVVPVERLVHFEKASIRVPSVSMQELRVLRDALLLSSTFVSLTLESSKPIDIASIDENLGADIPQDPPTPNYRYYPLSDCDDHVFEIHLHPKCLKMQRTPKKNLLR